MRHFFLLQPVPQPLQFRDNRSEPSRLLSRFPLQWPCHYADGQKLFSDINAGASFDCCTDHVRSPLCGLENSRRLPGIRSSSPQLLHSGVLHVHLASFVFGAKCAPLPTTAALSSPATDCTPTFSFPGVAKSGHPLSFRRSVSGAGWFVSHDGFGSSVAASFAPSLTLGLWAAARISSP